MTINKKGHMETKRESQPVDLPDEITIEAVAEYEKNRVNNPWNVQGMQPDKEYFFASQEPGYSPQNVQALEMMGYVKSSLKHNNPELILMECKKEIVEYRRTQDLLQDQRNRLQSMEPKGIPETSEHGGGVYRMPGHGLNRPS